MDIDAEFVPGTKKGSTNQLCDPEGYTYHINRQQHGFVYWRCKTHYSEGCRGSAVTQGRKLLKLIGEHTNHHIEKVHGNYGRSRSGTTRVKGSGVKDKMVKESSEPTVLE